MNKAITPVISIILIVLLTIVAGAGAYLFFSATANDLGSWVSGEQVISNAKLNLISVTGSKAIVINEGLSPVNEIILFINGEAVNYSLDTPIMPGEARNISYTSQSIGEDLSIKILYNNKEVSGVSPADKNTIASGFVVQMDLNEAECRNAGYVWLGPETFGDNGSCCGNNEGFDNFFKGDLATTNIFCLNGGYVKDEIDDNQLLCNNYNYLWFIGAATGDNNSCCGDDEENDNFFNGSIGSTNSFCYYGDVIGEEIDYNIDLCSYYDYSWIENPNYTFYNPLAYYKFDEGSGSNLSDEINDYSLNLINMSDDSWVNGRYGKGLHFDGINDYASIASDLGDPAAMTISLWFNKSNTNDATDYLLDARIGGNWWLISDYDTCGGITDNTGNVCFLNLVAIDPSDLEGNQWYHVVVTANSSESRIYLNGELKDVGAGLNPDIGVNLMVGARYTNANFFEGIIDEVIIYDYILTPEEIYDIYLGKPSCCGDDGINDNFYNGSIGDSENFCIAGEFVESNLDINEELCLNNGFDWVYGTTTGDYYSCCGDDGVSDNFSNSTHECVSGVLAEKASMVVLFEDLSGFDYKTIQGANWEQWSPLTEFTPAPSGWWGRAHDDQGLVKLTNTYRDISPLGDAQMFYIEVNPTDNGWVYGAEIYRNLTVELDSFETLNLSFYHAWFDDELIYASVDRRWYQWNFYIDTNNDFVLNTSDEYYQWVPNDGNYNNNMLKVDIGYPSNSVELANGVWEFINLDVLSAFYSKYGHYPSTSTGIMKFGFAGGKSCAGCGDTGYVYAFFDNITLSYK